MIHIWTRPIHFGRDHFITVVTKSLWSCPNQFGQTKTILDRPICFGHIEGQSISCLQKVGKKGKKIGQTRAVAIGFYQIHQEF